MTNQFYQVLYTCPDCDKKQTVYAGMTGLRCNNCGTTISKIVKKDEKQPTNR